MRFLEPAFLEPVFLEAVFLEATFFLASFDFFLLTFLFLPAAAFFLAVTAFFLPAALVLLLRSFFFAVTDFFLPAVLDLLAMSLSSEKPHLVDRKLPRAGIARLIRPSYTPSFDGRNWCIFAHEPGAGRGSPGALFDSQRRSTTLMKAGNTESCGSAAGTVPNWIRRAILLCVSVFALIAAHAEPRPAGLLQNLLDVRTAIVAAGAPERAAFMTVWDFDGTILDGDCSEGLQRDGQTVYPGLAQLSIENGLSRLYPADGGFADFWRDYTMLDERIGHWLAYPYILQMLRGASAGQLSNLAAQEFEARYRDHYFASSVYLIQALQAADIEVHIVSASAERFVRGAAASLDIDPGRFHGIRVAERDGLLTEELIYPVTWAEGKRRRLQEILQSRAEHEPDVPVFVIGGFGNSYNTDGPFLEWIARQSLPAGKPVAVMINGGPAPDAYTGLFVEIEQHEVTARGTD
jgi:phosphoserine phosphatase